MARSAGLEERASSQPLKQSGFCSPGWLRVSEEGSGRKRAIRARQFAPPICRRTRRKLPRTELIPPTSGFVGSDEDGGCR
jgi:hypothetical protein